MYLPFRLLLLFVFVMSHPRLEAQKKDYFPGYIITLEGDTISGSIKDRDPEPFVELYNRIRFIPEGRGKKTKFGPEDILGYSVEGRIYEAVPFREEVAFFKFRYYTDPGSPYTFLRRIRRDGPLTYYHREFIHDDNFFQDFYPLIHREGDREMVRVTQGMLGLKRERLAEYFRDCGALVEALATKELTEAEAVYDFYLDHCLEGPMGNPLLSTLEGLWEVDLRPDPEADPYTQEFRVTRVSANSFEGFFYGSPVESARLNRNWDELFFAFTTRDQTFEYYHSGYLRDGVLYGVSYCPGRELVQPWTGVRK
jgi:hypothetical protein